MVLVFHTSLSRHVAFCVELLIGSQCIQKKSPNSASANWISVLTGGSTCGRTAPTVCSYHLKYIQFFIVIFSCVSFLKLSLSMQPSLGNLRKWWCIHTIINIHLEKEPAITLSVTFPWDNGCFCKVNSTTGPRFSPTHSPLTIPNILLFGIFIN